MSRDLRIVSDLPLPASVVTQKLGWIGTSGGGKTYAATHLAEKMWDAKAQFVVLDPVGVWYGLRLDESGKRPSDITVPIFGGLHADVPLEPTAGAQLANLIVDRGISAVLDVSQFESDAAKARFAADFADRFFFRKKASPGAVHLFLEECQEFIPEHQQRGEERMLHVFTRVQKIGRNFGIGTSLITQRPQEVAKKALNLAQTLFVFRTTGTHERKSIETWIKDKAIEGQDVASELPKLKTGEPHVWSPEWLNVSRVVHITKKRTYDASATPEVGTATVARELAPIDLEKIRADMAAAIEKAKADDPKELRKEIAALKKQLATHGSSAIAAALAPPKAVVDDRAVKRAVDAAVKPIVADVNSRLSILRRAIGSVSRDAKALVGSLSGLESINLEAIAAPNGNGHAPAIKSAPVIKSPPRAVTPRATSRDSSASLSGARLKIARGLAELEAIGVTQAKRAQLSFYAGLTFSGGYGSNTLGAMRTEGLLDYPTDGYVALTDAGRAAAGEIDPPESLDELHARVRRHLSGLHERIFDAVVALGPGGSMTREQLGEMIGATFSGGYGSNTLGALRTAGIVDYPEKGTVGPSELLFPEGLS